MHYRFQNVTCQAGQVRVWFCLPNCCFLPYSLATCNWACGYIAPGLDANSAPMATKWLRASKKRQDHIYIYIYIYIYMYMFCWVSVEAWAPRIVTIVMPCLPEWYSIWVLNLHSYVVFIGILDWIYIFLSHCQVKSGENQTLMNAVTTNDLGREV